jgi:hypothetical protein
LNVINIRSKAKAKAKPAKKVKKSGRKMAVSVPRRPEGYFKDALTPEDIAEIRLFSRAIARNNARHS